MIKFKQNKKVLIFQRELRIEYDADTKTISIEETVDGNKFFYPELNIVSAYNVSKEYFKNFNEYCNYFSIDQSELQSFDDNNDDLTNIYFLLFKDLKEEDELLSNVWDEIYDITEQETFIELQEKYDQEDMIRFIFEDIYGTDCNIQKIIETFEFEDSSYRSMKYSAIQEYINSL